MADDITETGRARAEDVKHNRRKSDAAAPMPQPSSAALGACHQIIRKVA